jgi:DNA (cytosine-5)-methyltransferase 1
MKHGSLFSGIGGFDLAVEWMGWENIFHCEIAEFPRQILKYHFPNSICYEDIKKTDFTKHRGEIDIISGGFPCQPYSNAGKRRGKEDDRHLWPEMLRVIREVQPRFVVGENVAGLLSWNNGMVFHEIITDLENEGYETQAVLIPACATNAPHRRDRIWFIAHSNNARTNERMQFNGERKENDEQWRGQSQSEYRENGINGIITAHSNSNGCNEQDEKVNGREINKFQNRNKIWDKITTNGKPSNVAHTDGTEQGNNIGENIGEKREIRRGEEGNVFGELRSNGNVADTDSRNNKTWTQRKILGQPYREKANGYSYVECRKQWENFPTQSPICGGDDGIPTELDGITFSKWRNESIKGYGNAVVPQVVYQIFKAIEQSLL